MKLIKVLNEIKEESLITNLINKEMKSNFINFINYLKNNLNSKDFEEISDLSDYMYGLSNEQILNYLKIHLKQDAKFFMNNGLCNFFAKYILDSLNIPNLKVVGNKKIHVGIFYKNNVYDYNNPNGIDYEKWLKFYHMNK